MKKGKEYILGIGMRETLTYMVVTGLVTYSCLILAAPWTLTARLPCSLDSPRQEYWSGLHSLHQGVFPGPPALHADSLPTWATRGVLFIEHKLCTSGTSLWIWVQSRERMHTVIWRGKDSFTWTGHWDDEDLLVRFKGKLACRNSGYRAATVPRLGWRTPGGARPPPGGPAVGGCSAAAELAGSLFPRMLGEPVQ